MSTTKLVRVVWVDATGESFEKVIATESAKKLVKNIKRRKGVDKDSVAIVAHEVIVEEKPVEDTDGYMLFKDVANHLGVRYQQVFQKHVQNKLRSRRLNGKWYACCECVDVWQERRMRYLSANTRTSEKVVGLMRESSL